MKSYLATYGEHAFNVTARHLHEAQALACQHLGMNGKFQHLIKVRLTGETA